jgi:NAD(P)-dependent dehydrogenase (short-subunit alcohol dehydrogenase family)
MTTVRTVLVTGGNRGIGLAIAEEFITLGHRVADAVFPERRPFIRVRLPIAPAVRLLLRDLLRLGEQMDEFDTDLRKQVL